MESHAPGIYDYDPTIKVFFFDRSAEIFRLILNYCRTKHFHCPIDTCRSVLEEELAFGEIKEAQLASCCWLKLNNKEVHLEELDIWGENEQTDNQCPIVQTERRESWRSRWQPKIWSVFEKNFSSFSAKVILYVEMHTACALWDYWNGSMKNTNEFGALITIFGVPD